MRYQFTGGQVDEYQVQKDSGVLDELKELPMFKDYVGRNYKDVKKNIWYKLWVRATILWKLECEEMRPRAEIY